jgi:hypothetical protein
MSNNPTTYTEWRWMSGPSKDVTMSEAKTGEKTPWEQNMDGIYKRLQEMRDNRELFVRLPTARLSDVEVEERRLLKLGSNATAYEMVTMRMNVVELKNAYHHIDARLGHAIAERNLLEETLTVEKAERENRSKQAWSAEKRLTEALERVHTLEKELKKANEHVDGFRALEEYRKVAEKQVAEAKKRK